MKTNLLKSIFISLILVMGVSSAWATNGTISGGGIIYLNSGGSSIWDQANAWFSVYFMDANKSTTKFVSMTKVTGNYYYATVPTGTWTYVIFVRNNPTDKTADWTNVWNQTADLNTQSDKNLYTITGWSYGSWGTYQPTATGSLVASSSNNVAKNTNITLTPSISPTTYNVLKSTSYSISPSSGATISNNTFKATAGGSYTVTATITYNAKGFTNITKTATATTTITVKPTITFNANGGSGSMSAQTVSYNTNTTLSANTFTVPVGYTFNGWNTKTDGTGTAYAAGTSYKFTSDLTLYAQWAEIPANSHNITYNNGAGWTYGTQPTSAEEGATVTFEVIPTTGYTVTVTSSDVSLSNNGNTYTFTMPTKDVTINVSATENTHDVTVSYKCGDETIKNATMEAVGEVTPTSVTAPDIAGYAFTEWTLGTGITNKSANTTTNPINITTEASGTYTLTANYEKVVTVYFVNSSEWAIVTCHHWHEGGSGTSWPGDQLTTTGETVNEFDVYKATFTNEHDMCIFSNNGASQTANLEVQDGKYYYLLKNQWYDSLNDIPAIDPLATNVFIAGGMNEWSTNTDEFRKATKEATTASIILNLSANTDYEFKVIRDGAWTGYKGTITKDAAGLQFSSSTSDNAKITTTVAGDYTFTWTISSSQLAVTYPTLYAVTATANDAAMGTIEGAGNYGKGSTATLTATPNDGYLFVNWTKGGEVVATTQEYSFTVTAAVELVANFEAAPEEVHNVTVSYVCGGNQIADDQTVAAVGVTTVKTVEAPEIWGYTFSSWTLGEDVISANELTSNTIDINIKAGGSDFTLTANYTEIPKVTVYFVNNKKWSKVYAYGWGGSVGENPAWPGQEITANKEVEQIVGFDVYSYSVVPGSYDNIIFNKGEGGDGNQTETFKWTDGKYYYMGAADQYVGGTRDEVTTIIENEVLATNVYLAGKMTNWGEGKLQFRKKAAGDEVATVTVELTEGIYEFKIVEDGKWLGNNGTMTRQYHENWIFREKQDDETTDEVNATIDADENGIYTFTWNSTDNKLTVTYPAPTAKYIYFKNNPGWNKVYVYFFQEHNFNDKGAVSTGLTVANKRVGEMTQVGSSDIWQYEYGTAGLPLSGVIAFTETLQENKSNFSNTKAAYRTDFNKNMELFIPQKTSNETKNNTKYYSTGLWMKYNSTESGYVFANNIDDEWKEDRLVADAPGGYHFATQVSLGGNTTYNFKVKNIKGDWFGKKSTTMTSTNTNVELEVGAGDEYNVKLTTTSAGNYTFSIDLSDGKMMVSVEYPLQTSDYRLVYVESEVLGQAPYTKFHPAQSIRGIAEGTKKDIVSFYINKDGKNPAILLQQCTNINGANITWTDVAIQSINGNQGANPVGSMVPAKRSVELYIGEGCPAVTENGVYNFVLEQTNGTATILNEETHPYTGDYYIRTNAADGGWRKYNTNPDNIMTHSQTALKHGGYDYYFCKWVLKDQSVQYVVANDYSYCVSDTLTTDAIVTNVNGILPANANVRYTWNSSTNTLSRAYLAGSGNIADRYLVLVGNANLKDTSENPFDVSGLNPNEVAFKDMENWLYQLDVKANQNTLVKLTADYNKKTQYFKGSADDTEQLIKGSGNYYTLRLIYDFKTNYLVSGLVGNQTITGDLELEEVMIVRSHHDEAQTLKISNGSVTANKAYGVMTFKKNTLNGAGSQHERALYWVSFPFNVKLDEAFGFGNYGEHWIMEYYDGEARAKNGAWVDSDTYWKYITEPKGYTLEAGKGYVLCLDLDLLGNDSEFWDHENTEIALYFPSCEENPIVINNAATQRETRVPEYICTIERDDRDIEDSNWNIIGVPAYTKIAGMTGGGVISYYRYDASKNEYDPAMTSGFNFNTMHAYMVQYAGTINWTEQATSIAALAARKSPTSKDQYTLRLALQQEGTDHDHTFIRLQEDNATAEFDMNYDLCKIINSGANIYSMINNVEVAANVLPVEERVIPIGLDIHETGNYTFAMPDGTDGITAILIDYETGKETNLLLADYTTELREGTNNERFALRVRPNHVATEVETIIDGANGQIQKYIINGALYILNNGQLYDAQGRMVQP